MLDTCKLILVDDHKMFREGLRFLLAELPQVQILAEAENGKEFLNLLNDHQPDLVLMDINMPEMDGVEATKLALERYPEMRIIALTMFGEEDYYYKMIHAGARGFLLKESGSSELEMAIRAVMQGKDYFSVDLLKNLVISLGKEAQNIAIEGRQIDNLTTREVEILRLLCTGLSAKEIASELNISPRTVETHKARLFEKTHTQNTTSLIMTAIRHKLIVL